VLSLCCGPRRSSALPSYSSRDELGVAEKVGRDELCL
jgi:hypothetical protein